MSFDLDAVRAREAAATPGPWQWFGNTDVNSIYLATKKWGRTFIMQFSRWGMRGAQPVFAEGRTWKVDPRGDLSFAHAAGMTKAQDLPVYEVAPNATTRTDPNVYRADLSGIRNPDAEFIAHARQDVTDLLAEVDRLTAALAEADLVISSMRLAIDEADAEEVAQ